VGGLVTALVTAAAVLAGCGGPEAPTLTLYSAQHSDLVKAWTDGFTKDTGITVNVRRGGDFELANQILAEGDSSPADVFVTENSPAQSLLSSKGALAPLDRATLDQVPARFSSGSGDWVGVAARSTVLVYNPALLPADQLPKNILELSDPKWQGKIGCAAGGADFQAIASAVYAVDGDQKAGEWLAGLKRNAKIYQNNIATMKAVNAGEVAAGVIYHYYWFKDRAENGRDSDKAQLAYFAPNDAGAFVSVSGGSVVKSSKHAAEAQRFINYISGPAGQKILTDTLALQYPVGNGVAPNPKLKPFTELQPPAVDQNTLNGPKVIAEMQRVGLI
jgi:iron(III) transport system substrate-binding protein